MLSTPPAFVLSQDQTLIKKCLIKLISLNINILNLTSKIQRNLLVYLILILCLIFKDHFAAVRQLLYNITITNGLSILFFQYQLFLFVCFFSFVSCDVFYDNIIIFNNLILPHQLANAPRVHLIADYSFDILVMRPKYVMRY